MKKITLLCLSLVAAFSASASIAVCDTYPDENGNFDCPYITSGSITWDEASHTLTLDNAIVEHSSESPYDYVYPICVTEDATIIIHGDCKLTTTGFCAVALEGTNSKNVAIQGNGSLYLDSRMRGIYLRCARLTIKDIILLADKGIMNNGDGVLCALTFDNVKADINGVVERIGEAISFRNCGITYPGDAYIEHIDYGYYIATGDGDLADHIIISRTSDVKGDVNGDGEVNIADVNAIINVILGDGSNAFADVNADGEINIADVNVVINIILGGDAPTPDNHEYVDLGLPSGTLWATCNVGANSPEEFGHHFAWGETEPKDVYDRSTYKWCNGSYTTITKYCTNSEYGYNGFVDNKTELDLEDDAAYVNWGPSWCMPTVEQQQELYQNCSSVWTTKNGVNGRLFTGPNGNTLFLPAAGGRWDGSLYYVGSYGYYWSRTLYTCFSRSDLAYNLDFTSGYVGCDGDDRIIGFTVRAVRAPQN